MPYHYDGLGSRIPGPPMVELRLKASDIPSGKGTIRMLSSMALGISAKELPFKLGNLEGVAFVSEAPTVSASSNTNDVELDVRIFFPKDKPIDVLAFYELLGAEVTRDDQ